MAEALADEVKAMVGRLEQAVSTGHAAAGLLDEIKQVQISLASPERMIHDYVLEARSGMPAPDTYLSKAAVSVIDDILRSVEQSRASVSVLQERAPNVLLLARELEPSFNELKERIETQGVDWDDRLGTCIGDLQAGAVARCDQGIKEIEGAVNSMVVRLQEAIETHLQLEPHQFIEAQLYDLLAVHERTAAALEQEVRRLAEDLVGSVEDATEIAAVKLRQRAEQAVRSALQEAVEGMLRDAFESTALSQIGVSITSSLSPVLPQLMAAKALLSAIRSALEALRLGL